MLLCSCVCSVVYYYNLYVFFFKQKTAYEMRISDWSSDVCSSDLFFERNKQLCARLGTPLDLSPLAASKQRDAIHFKAFCSRYDDKLVESGAVRKSPGLDRKSVV